MPKRVGNLYQKMADRELIRRVILEAARKKTHRRDVAPVLKDLDAYVERTYEMVATESFAPTTPREKRIYDESSQKYRIIKMVPFWPDGVMHWLLVTVMKPVLMRGMYSWSCASIPGRGCKRVHTYIGRALRKDPKGTKYAAELDVAQYYPSISIRKLIWALSRKIKDKKLLRTVYSVLESCGGGLAIGYFICQWLANFYLETLDRYILTMPGVKYMTRHMDNITLIGPNKKRLHKAVELIRAYMRDALGLTLKKNWQVYRTGSRMISAVGYRFSSTHIILRKRNFLRFTRQCRRVKKRLDAGRPIAFVQAAGLLSRAGQLRHCNSQKIRVKYIDPIGVKTLKEVVRYETQRRQRSGQCVHDGGAA